MNKLLNKKVVLSFALSGVSYTSSNIKKLQYVTLIFVNVIFFQWWTTLCYIFFNLDEEEQQGKLQDNVI